MSRKQPVSPDFIEPFIIFQKYPESPKLNEFPNRKAPLSSNDFNKNKGILYQRAIKNIRSINENVVKGNSIKIKNQVLPWYYKAYTYYFNLVPNARFEEQTAHLKAAAAIPLPPNNNNNNQDGGANLKPFSPMQEMRNLHRRDPVEFNREAKRFPREAAFILADARRKGTLHEGRLWQLDKIEENEGTFDKEARNVERRMLMGVDAAQQQVQFRENRRQAREQAKQVGQLPAFLAQEALNAASYAAKHATPANAEKLFKNAKAEGQGERFQARFLREKAIIAKNRRQKMGEDVKNVLIPADYNALHPNMSKFAHLIMSGPIYIPPPPLSMPTHNVKDVFAVIPHSFSLLDAYIDATKYREKLGEIESLTNEPCYVIDPLELLISDTRHYTLNSFGKLDDSKKAKVSDFQAIKYIVNNNIESTEKGVVKCKQILTLLLTFSDEENSEKIGTLAAKVLFPESDTKRLAAFLKKILARRILPMNIQMMIMTGKVPHLALLNKQIKAINKGFEAYIKETEEPTAEPPRNIIYKGNNSLAAEDEEIELLAVNEIIEMLMPSLYQEFLIKPLSRPDSTPLKNAVVNTLYETPEMKEANLPQDVTYITYFDELAKLINCKNLLKKYCKEELAKNVKVQELRGGKTSTRKLIRSKSTKQLRKTRR